MIKIFSRTNGGGGGKAPAPPPPPAAPPPPPPSEDQGPDPEMQAEIERQRALRFKAGQIGSATSTTGADETLGSSETTNKTTILGA